MTRLVLTIAIASIIAIGFMNVLKNLLPDTISKKIKTIIGVVLDAVIGVLVAMVSVSFIEKHVITKIAYIIVTSVGTVGITQFIYDYVAKLIDAIKTKLKN